MYVYGAYPKRIIQWKNRRPSTIRYRAMQRRESMYVMIALSRRSDNVTRIQFSVGSFRADVKMGRGGRRRRSKLEGEGREGREEIKIERGEKEKLDQSVEKRGTGRELDKREGGIGRGKFGDRERRSGSGRRRKKIGPGVVQWENRMRRETTKKRRDVTFHFLAPNKTFHSVGWFTNARTVSAPFSCTFSSLFRAVVGEV